MQLWRWRRRRRRRRQRRKRRRTRPPAARLGITGQEHRSWALVLLLLPCRGPKLLGERAAPITFAVRAGFRAACPGTGAGRSGEASARLGLALVHQLPEHYRDGSIIN